LSHIKNSQLYLNDYGKIIEKCWLKLKSRYDYIDLDNFVVMPNHFHGIIILDSVGTGRDLSLQPKRKSLSELMGVFKTTSSKQIHIAGLKSFRWQRSFYDRIMRNEKELYKIRKYIEQNPLAWNIEKNPHENINSEIPL
jgi:putative transposase